MAISPALENQSAISPIRKEPPSVLLQMINSKRLWGTHGAPMIGPTMFTWMIQPSLAIHSINMVSLKQESIWSPLAREWSALMKSLSWLMKSLISMILTEKLSSNQSSQCPKLKQQLQDGIEQTLWALAWRQQLESMLKFLKQVPLIVLILVLHSASSIAIVKVSL